MLEYLGKAFSVWLVGFFPFAEIYVAVPAGFGLGLDIYSIVIWSVFGNYIPAVIITLSFDALLRHERINRWLIKFSSNKVRSRLERHGVWTTLLLTPWLGVWAMAVTVKFFGMPTRQFLWASFISILVYAIVLAMLIHLGFEIFSG